MKEKIQKILLKPQNIFSKKSNSITAKEEIKQLRQENEKLKKSFEEQCIEKFKTRRSIRKFSNKQIDYKLIHTIIESGLNAPCAGNIQNTKIIVVDNQETKYKAAQAALQQYWISDAPYCLVIVRDDNEIINVYPEYGKTYSIQNTAALIENIIMTTHFYNLGACWVECGDNNVLKSIFNVPPHLNIDAIIPIGYPLENPTVKKIPTKNMVYFNSWDQKSK
ncbi:MAG: nitroreductase family protein [archaeon]